MPLRGMLEAGANCLPAALLFLALGALGVRRSRPARAAGVAYGLVAVAFLWELVGSLLGAPRWLLDLDARSTTSASSLRSRSAPARPRSCSRSPQPPPSARSRLSRAGT